MVEDLNIVPHTAPTVGSNYEPTVDSDNRMIAPHTVDIEFDKGVTSNGVQAPSEFTPTSTTIPDGVKTVGIQRAYEMDNIESFFASGLYDSTLTGIYNVASKPKAPKDDTFISEDKADGLKKLSEQYGGYLTPKMVDMYNDNVNNQKQLEWFNGILNNKMLTEQGWKDGTLGALTSMLFDPINFVGGAGLFSKVGKAKSVYDIIMNAKGVKKIAISGGLGASAGFAQAVPGVAFNFDDDAVLMYATALGGAFGVGLAAGKPIKELLKELPAPRKVDTDAVDPVTGIPTSEKKPLSKLDVWIARVQSVADELYKLNPKLATTIFSMAQKGSLISAMGAQARVEAFRRELDVPLAKFEAAMTEIGKEVGYDKTLGARMGEVLLDKDAEPPASVLARLNRTAMAFLKQTHNWESRAISIKAETDSLLKKLKDVSKNFNNKTDDIDLTKLTDTDIDNSINTLKEYADEYNRLRTESYNRELAEYNEGGKVGTKPVLPEKYHIPTHLLNRVVKPLDSQIDATAMKIVKAYRDSGYGRKAGELINQMGVGMQKVHVSDNYIHTGFSSGSIMKAVDSHIAELLENFDTTVKLYKDSADLAAKELKEFTEQNVTPYVTKTGKPKKKGFKGLVKQNKDIQEKLKAKADEEKAKYDNYMRQITDENGNPDRFRLEQRAIEEVATRIGTQIAEVVNSVVDEAHKINPTHVGALIMAKNFPEVGHVGMKEFLKSQEQNMTEQLFITLAETAGDFTTDIARKLDNVGLEKAVKSVTSAEKFDVHKAVGVPSTFRHSFNWDYFRSKEDGGYMADFMEPDMYKMLERNSQETSSTVGLSAATFEHPRTGEVLQLNNPRNIQIMLDDIHDRAVASGHYSEDEAVALANHIGDVILGRPLGEALGPIGQAFTTLAQAIQLRNSGLYNLVDFVNITQAFGISATIKSFMPAIKNGLSLKKLTPKDGDDLAKILSHMVALDGRIKPNVTRVLDDFHEVHDNKFNRNIMYWGQYTRFLNGQELTRRVQSNMVASCYQNELEKAIKSGDFATRFETYFSKDDQLLIQKMHRKYGMETARWDPAIRRKVMIHANDTIDNIILNIRRGERPRFLSSQTGKLIFAYQSFVFAAHNKLMRRITHDDGMLNASMFIAQQAPLAALVSGANNLLSNKPFDEDLATGMATSMSSLGLWSIIVNIMSRGEFGGFSPPIAAVDSMFVQLPQELAAGDVSGVGKNIPFLSVFMPWRMFVSAITSENK